MIDRRLAKTRRTRSRRLCQSDERTVLSIISYSPAPQRSMTTTILRLRERVSCNHARCSRVRCSPACRNYSFRTAPQSKVQSECSSCHFLASCLSSPLLSTSSPNLFPRTICILPSQHFVSGKGSSVVQVGIRPFAIPHRPHRLR